MVGQAVPIVRRRPTRTTDGQGGYMEAYGSPYNFFGVWSVHQNNVIVSFDRQEDVAIEDVLLDIDQGAFYRVLRMLRTAEAQYKTAILEKIERPIHP